MQEQLPRDAKARRKIITVEAQECANNTHVIPAKAGIQW
jgi:hypothetical protein